MSLSPRTIVCCTALLVTFAPTLAGRAAEDPPPRMDRGAHLLLPSPVAWIDSPRALEINPAGLGFRRAAGAELAVGSELPDGDLVGLGGYGGIWGLAGGGRLSFHETGTAGQASVGGGIAPLSGLSVGATLHVHAPAGGVQPYAAADFGLAMRPTSWLALGGAARDLARWKDRPGRYSPNVAAGMAIRPFGRRFSLAVDWWYETAAPPNPHHFAITALVEPVDGVRISGTVDDDLQIGVGLTLAFNAGWVGAQSRFHDPRTPGLAGWTAAVGISREPDPSRLRLSRSVAEVRLAGLAENPTPFLLTPRRGPRRFADVLEELRDLEDQPSVQAVLLRLDGYGEGLAHTEELRDAIARLQAAGKPVYAYLEDGGGNVDYYLASACDAVWMHPGATLSLTGLRSRLFFYKGAMDKFGVEAQFSRIGIYKTSPERFLFTHPTDPNLEVRNATLDDRFERWLGALAEGRGMDAGAMRAFIDDGPYPARLAVDRGLIDELVYPDEVRARAKEEVGRSGLAIRHPLEEREADAYWRAPRRIAVIHVDGLINTGRSGKLPLGLLTIAGSDTLTAAVRNAREDRSINAIVLRVDSPGGSAFASEAIWREVHRTRGVKPVVVSMAGSAASGGYFVACPADHIVANPSTTTGSIGVYSGKVSLAGLYAKLGINSVRLKRGEHAGLYDMTDPWSPAELRAVERTVDALYGDFIEHVREGRGFDDVAQVDEIARGRVWTGAQAVEIGLVDETGGLMRAVEVARERAGMPARLDVELVHMPRVPLLTSLRIGKGFVAEPPTLPLPLELRLTLSELLLMELQQGTAPALMLMPGVEIVE